MEGPVPASAARTGRGVRSLPVWSAVEDERHELGTELAWQAPGVRRLRTGAKAAREEFGGGNTADAGCWLGDDDGFTWPPFPSSSCRPLVWTRDALSDMGPAVAVCHRWRVGDDGKGRQLYRFERQFLDPGMASVPPRGGHRRSFSPDLSGGYARDLPLRAAEDRDDPPPACRAPSRRSTARRSATNCRTYGRNAVSKGPRRSAVSTGPRRSAPCPRWGGRRRPAAMAHHQIGMVDADRRRRKARATNVPLHSRGPLPISSTRAPQASGRGIRAPSRCVAVLEARANMMRQRAVRAVARAWRNCAIGADLNCHGWRLRFVCRGRRPGDQRRVPVRPAAGLAMKITGSMADSPSTAAGGGAKRSGLAGAGRRRRVSQASRRLTSAKLSSPPRQVKIDQRLERRWAGLSARNGSAPGAWTVSIDQRLNCRLAL